jgi:hypothetical protein
LLPHEEVADDERRERRHHDDGHRGAAQPAGRQPARDDSPEHGARERAPDAVAERDRRAGESAVRRNEEQRAGERTRDEPDPERAEHGERRPERAALAR